MKVDNAEFGLLTAITIFSERKNLKQRKRVEKIQEIYVDALRSYVMSHRKKDPIVAFAKLLGTLVELRSLGNLNSRTCFDLKLVNRRLPDFLAEIWDIKWWAGNAPYKQRMLGCLPVNYCQQLPQQLGRARNESARSIAVKQRSARTLKVKCCVRAFFSRVLASLYDFSVVQSHRDCFLFL